MTTAPLEDTGALSQLLEELARVPRMAVPDSHFLGLKPGASIGRFIVEKEIGRGGFGVVYAALDPELGRTVALKLLKPGVGLAHQGVDWIRREAEAVARLSHPGIVTLFDVGHAPEGPFLVFELLQGETLGSRLLRGPLPPAEVVRIALAVAQALAHAHQALVLHRDLKPANVFLCADGSVKVLDFGVAHLFGRDTNSTGGTPGYMAPEQREARSGDARTDLYAFGIMLRVMLGGAEERASGLRAAAPVPGPRRAGAAARVPEALRRLVLDLTRGRPDQRPASIHPVLERLGALSAELGPRPPIRRVASVLAASLLALVASGYMLFRTFEPAPGERLVVVVADTANASGEPLLDDVSELLSVALGQSHRLQLVTRARLLAAAAASKLPATPLDAVRARALASQVGATTVVQPGVRRAGSGFELDLTVRSLVDERVLFQGQATAPHLEAVPSALDSLVYDVRRALRERKADVAASPAALAEMTTPSLLAFQHYIRGLACMDRASEATARADLERCSMPLRRSLEADPAFILAHYQLSYLMGAADRGSAEARSQLDAALAGVKRLSRRDAAMVLAWKDHLDNRDDEAISKYVAVLGEYADDLQLLFLVGDLQFHLGRYRDAAPYFAKALALDPLAEWALDHLVESYALSGLHQQLGALLERLRPANTPAHVRALVHGYIWLGDPARSIATARQAAAADPSPAARYLLVGALTAAAEFEAAQALVEDLAMAEPGSPIAFVSRVTLARTLGQARRAWRLTSQPGARPDAVRPVDLAFLKSMLAAGDGDLPRLLAETQKVVSAAPELAPISVVVLALLGSTDQVRAFVGALPAGSVAVEEVEALRAWRAGDTTSAVARLTALEQRAPSPADALAPSYLIAEVALEKDPSEALAAAARFRAQWPRGLWRSWAYPRSLLISALASERLGDGVGASAHAERLALLLRSADGDLRLLRDLALLRTRLAGAPGARKPAPALDR